MLQKKELNDLSTRVADLARQLDSIYTALVIRDPGTPISAETYEGLRRQVIASAQERLAHLVQLSEFDVAIRSGADRETLARLVDSWLAQAGLEISQDPTHDLRFEAVTGDGPWEVALPAYVDSATGRTIRQGRLRAAVHAPPTPPVESADQNPKAASSSDVSSADTGPDEDETSTENTNDKGDQT